MTALSVLAALFEVLCDLLYFDTFQSRRPFAQSRGGTAALCAILYGAGALSRALNLGVGGQCLVAVAVFFAVLSLCYRGTFLSAAGISLTLVFIQLGVHFSASALLGALFPGGFALVRADALYGAIFMMVRQLAVFVAVLSIYLLWKSGPLRLYAEKAHWLLLLYGPLVAVVSILALLTDSDPLLMRHHRVLAAFSAVGLLFLGRVTFQLARSITRQERRTRENELLRQKVAIEIESVKALSQAQDAQRRIMHDYENQIATIHLLLAQGSHARAQEYVCRLSRKSLPALRRIRTRNDVLDAVLNQKCAQAQESDIQIEVLAEDMSHMPMHSDDTVVVLANVLDNALEACRKLEGERWIRVKLAQEGGVFVISVVNPVGQRVPVVGNRVATTKDNPQLHGHGLYNVEAALENYSGSYELFSDDDTFQFTAVVPTDASARVDTIC